MNRKPKLLFWLDKGFIEFAIGKKLQNILDYDGYAIIDSTKHVGDFFSNQNIVFFKKSWNYSKFIKKPTSKPDYEYLKLFEKKYSIDITKIIKSERFFYPEYNKYFKFSKDEIYSIIEQECKFFEKILDEIKPDCLCISIITRHHLLLLYEMCKSNAILILTPEPTHFAHRWVLSNETDIMIDSKKFNSFNSNLNLSFQQLENILKKYQPLVHGQYDKTKNKTIITDKIKSRFNFLFYKNSHFHFTTYGKTKFNILLKGTATSHKIKLKKREAFMKKYFLNHIPKETFIYYPLSYEPEKRLLINNLEFSNQIVLIKNIVNSLPDGFFLFVKEHPAMDDFAWRPIDYYKEILSLPKLKMIHPSVSNTKLIKDCKLVITINGTAGLEAAFYQKPSITFSHTSGYSELPSVLTVNSLNELPLLIKQALNTIVDLSDLNKYVDYFEKNAITFNQLEFTTELSTKFNYNLGDSITVNINPNDLEEFLNDYDEMFEKMAQKHVELIKENLI